MRDLPNIARVVDGRLCCGCGACAVVCPQGAISIKEGAHYNFALVDGDKCVGCGRCLDMCPGKWSLLGDLNDALPEEPEGQAYWLARSTDEDMRRDAASGGLVTGLLAHMLECGEIDGAVVVRAEANRPLYSRAGVARSTEELLGSRGSRYLPVSSCLGLREIMEKPGTYAFVGKPCEISALRRLQAAVPALAERVVLAVGLFCAQTPARSRTEAFLKSVGVDLRDVTEIEFRGRGWPGRFRAYNGEREVYDEPYGAAWSFLAKGLPAASCFLCDDGMARDADISVGDPWGLPEGIDAGTGISFVAARTAAGKDAIAGCARRGSIALEEAPQSFVAGRLRVQAKRAASAARRRLTYSAVFARRGIARAFRSNGLAFAPTIFRQRFRVEYY